jgi:energy-coupling factor transporter ATP-binding protein EcfA2
LPLWHASNSFSTSFQIETTDVEIEKTADVEQVNHEMREGFTSALLFDRSPLSPSFRRNEQSVHYISTQLKADARLVIVGDPGCGKTTLLSFLAYSYACRQLPQALQPTFLTEKKIAEHHKALPDEPWIPVTLICRELLGANFDGRLIDLIQHQLHKSSYSSSDIQLLVRFFENQMSEGKVLLLVDSLDEIPVEKDRQKFATLIANQAIIHSQAPIVLTSRVVGFRSIQKPLNSFKHLNVRALGIDEKKQFVQSFIKFVSALPSDQESISVVSKLEDLVCSDRNAAKLCDNIFLLVLITQMFLQDDSLLGGRRVDVYRHAVEQMIKRRMVECDEDALINEICPHLEHLAYCMRLEGDQYWREPEVIENIKELRKNEADAVELHQRQPKELLSLIINQSGLLNLAGPDEIDGRGFKRHIIQFFHQSFQEYFAAQALLHGRGIYDRTPVLDRLRQLVHELEIAERKIESLGTGEETEPVAGGNWQEVIRFCISSLNRKQDGKQRTKVTTADDAMLMLLPSNNAPMRESRALSIFALQTLVEEPDLRSETINTVLDTAIDNLNEFDGVNTNHNTLMDEALHSVIRSRFSQRCRERLLRGYIRSRDVHRNKIGSVYLTAAIDSEALNAENAAHILEPLLAKLNTVCSVEERVDAALRLVDVFYYTQWKNSNTRIDFLPDNLLRKTVNLLLKTATSDAMGYDENDAVLSSVMWAFVWLTSAKTSTLYTTYRFTDIELDCIREIAMDERRDPYSRVWSTLILSICGSEKVVSTQADWILEWAGVADGSKPHKELPVAHPLNRPKDIQILKNLISSNLPPQAKRRVAIAMGRLGCFVREMVEPLLEVFQDDLSLSDDRDEALVFLVFIGGVKVISSLIEIMNHSKQYEGENNVKE